VGRHTCRRRKTWDVDVPRPWRVDRRPTGTVKQDHAMTWTKQALLCPLLALQPLYSCTILRWTSWLTTSSLFIIKPWHWLYLRHGSLRSATERSPSPQKKLGTVTSSKVTSSSCLRSLKTKLKTHPFSASDCKVTDVLGIFHCKF